MYSQKIQKTNENKSELINSQEQCLWENSNLTLNDTTKRCSSTLQTEEFINLPSSTLRTEESLNIIIKNTFICNFYKNNPQINIETVNLYIIELIRPCIEGFEKLNSQTTKNEFSSPLRYEELLNLSASKICTSENIKQVNEFEKCRGIKKTIKNENTFSVERSKSILYLLNKLYTTGNILPVNDSTMMFSRKPEKIINISKNSPKKRNKQPFFKSIEEPEKINTEKNNLNLHLYSQNSFSPNGFSGENMNFNLPSQTTENWSSSTIRTEEFINLPSQSSANLRDFTEKNVEEYPFTVAQEGKWDTVNNESNLLSEFELCIIKRTNKCNILVESRNTEININNEEIQEFIQLMEENNCHGVFLSQNSGFISKQDFHIEIYNKLIVVYVHNVEYNEQKIRMAINIIDNLAIKIRELHRQEDIYEVIIDKETLNEINKEYQTFIQQKENLINIFKENQKQFLLQIEEFKFPELNKYLSTKFSIPTNKQGFKCDLCKKFNGNNLKALAAHKRGCLRKTKLLLEKNSLRNFSEKNVENPYLPTQFTENESFTERSVEKDQFAFVCEDKPLKRIVEENTISLDCKEKWRTSSLYSGEFITFNNLPE